MDKFVKQVIDYILDFDSTSQYLFCELYGFTFVFRRDITITNNRLTSAEILPVGLIYEENNEFYYAPLHGQDEIDEIIREFVKNLKKEN